MKYLIGYQLCFAFVIRLFAHQFQQIADCREKFFGFIFTAIGQLHCELLMIWALTPGVGVKNLIAWHFQICNDLVQIFKFWIATPGFCVKYGSVAQSERLCQFFR